MIGVIQKNVKLKRKIIFMREELRYTSNSKYDNNIYISDLAIDAIFAPRIPHYFNKYNRSLCNNFIVAYKNSKRGITISSSGKSRRNGRERTGFYEARHFGSSKILSCQAFA